MASKADRHSDNPLATLLSLSLHRYRSGAWRVYLTRLDSSTRRMVTTLMAEGDGVTTGTWHDEELLDVAVQEMRALRSDQLPLF